MGMELKTFDVLKMMYWGLRRDRHNLSHLVHIAFDFCRAFALLFWWKYIRGRRQIVLIAQVEFMGDILATEPISRVARNQFPDAYIVWVARRQFKEMIKNFSAVDNVLSVVCLTEWMLLLSTGICDTVWDLHVSDHYCIKCVASLHKSAPASGITYDTYYDFGNLLTVACLCAGIPPIADAPILNPDRRIASRIDALHLPRDFVVLHCTSNDQKRNWTEDKWQRLVTYIVETLGRSVVEIGLRPVLADVTSGHVRNLCGKLPILETAEVVRRATLFIGVDSGPAQIANAVGTPGVIVFGKFRCWHDYMPYSGAYQTGDNADLIRTSGSLQDLAIEPVVQAVVNRLNRSHLQTDHAPGTIVADGQDGAALLP
jgi:heptosyltransferase III